MTKSLSLKIIALLTALFLLLFVSLAYFSYNIQKASLTAAFIERARATTYSLQVAIETKEDIANGSRIFSSIQKNMLLDSEITDIHFSVPQEGVLKVFVSSKPNSIGTISDSDNHVSLTSDAELDSISVVDGLETLKVVTPVHISGKTVATIQVNFTLENVNQTIKSSILKLLIVYLLMMILFLVLVYWALRFTIVKPILDISGGMKAVAENNFDYHLNTKSDDEIGSLGKSFEKMALIIKEARSAASAKVELQTNEIEEKSQELENQKSAILNILEDVQSKEQKAELLAGDLAKFKLAVENASDQVVITDTEGMVIYGNRAVERITGYTPEEALGKKAGVLWKMPMPHEYYVNMWDVIKNQKKVYVGEIQNKRKDGTIYIAQLSISPVLDKNKNLIYFVAIEHDITKEKQIDKAKTEFVSLASHQLRTPLSAINWYTEMLIDQDVGPINEEQKKYLNEVANGTQRMVELVNALLNVSRLDLGTFIIEPVAVNVVDMAKSVVDESKSEITSRNLNVEQIYAEGIPEFQADKKLLRIVMQNLLSNAVKYTPHYGSIKFSLSVVHEGEMFGGVKVSVDSLAIAVADTGMGIPPEQKDRIFSKMFRADNARETETEGTGLGLYLIKSVIDHSGGGVWFESELNKGTTFYVVFPLSGMKKREGTRSLD